MPLPVGAGTRRTPVTVARPERMVVPGSRLRSAATRAGQGDVFAMTDSDMQTPTQHDQIPAQHDPAPSTPWPAVNTGPEPVTAAPAPSAEPAPAALEEDPLGRRIGAALIDL